MKAIKIEMTLERETKGTYVYKSDDITSPVKTIYIQKNSVTPEDLQDFITVNIS